MGRWSVFSRTQHPFAPMKTRLLRAPSITSLLLLPFPAFAVTETWDGGGANDNFSTR